MQLPPASVLSSWPTPNYVNPETRGHIGMVIGVLLGGLVTITLAIRLYVRKWLTRGFGFDDVFIILAYFPATTFTIIGAIAEDQLQWNRHTWDVEIKYIEPGFRLTLANDILFNTATTLTKISILAQLYRLTTASGDRKMTIAALISIAFIGLNCFVFIMVSIFQCTPLSDFWKFSAQPPNCINQSAHMMVANVINTVTDWLVVLLPIKTALGLKLPTKQISMVIFLFGAGILASSAGIARSYYAWVMSTEYDIVWNSWLAWFCSAIELNLGIICASVPAMKPFFASYLPNVFETIFKKRNSKTLDWDRRPLTQSPSLTTFIDQSSTSSSSLPRQPEPLLSRPQPVNLNKPLPPIITDTSNRRPDLEAQLTFLDASNSLPRSLTAPPQRRVSARFNDRYRGLASRGSQSRDRTTIFIMYRADNDQAPIQQILNRASLA
ncbi:integral membrane protein [Hypoxylon sp. NC0597]|nr:integral membrane protein [Hypoxylon sp. NC0597]